MPITIRPVDRITAQHWQLLLAADPSQAMILRYLDKAHVFEAYRDAHLCGLIALVEQATNRIEIMNLAVTPADQGQGIGTRLLTFALNWAEQCGATRVEIGTGSTSFEQLYLYQKMGFRVVAVVPNFFLDHYDDPIVENKLVLKDMIRLALELKP